MTEAPLLRWCDVQTRLLAAVVQDLMKAGDAAAIDTRVAPLLPLMTDYCEQGRQSLEMMRTAQFFKRINVKQTQAIGRITRETLPRVISLLETLRKHCRRARERGAPLERADEFDQAVTRFRHDAIEFLMHWPWNRWEDPEQSAETEERGELRDARDVLNELLHQALAREQGHETDRLVEPEPAPHP